MLLGLRAPAWAAKHPGHDRPPVLRAPACSASASAASSRPSSRPPASPCASAARGSTTRCTSSVTCSPASLSTYEGRTMSVNAAVAAARDGRPAADLRRRPRRGGAPAGRRATATCGCRCGSRPTRVAERTQTLAELAEREGRPAPGTALLIGVHIDDDRARARAEAELHIRGQYRMGLDKIEHWTLLDSVDGAVEQLEAYSEAGVEEFLLHAARPRAAAPSTSAWPRSAGASKRHATTSGAQGPGLSVETTYRYDAVGVPRRVRAPLHLPGRRAAQQPPLRRSPRAARSRPRGRRWTYAELWDDSGTARRRPREPTASTPATWSSSTCSTAPSSCSCGSPRSGWARSPRRSTSASPPARSPTSSTTAARRPSSTTPRLAADRRRRARPGRHTRRG